MSDSHVPAAVPSDPAAPSKSPSAETSDDTSGAVTSTATQAAEMDPQSSGSDAAAQAAKGPRVLIGTQRPGAAPVKVEPRVKAVYSTPAADTATATPPQRQKQREPDRGPPRPRRERGDEDSEDLESAERESPRSAPVVATPPQPVAQQETISPIQAGTTESLTPKPAPLAPGTPKAAAPRFVQGPKVELPNIREELPPELSQELDKALGNMSLEDLIAAESREATAAAEDLEPDSRHKVRVIRIHRDNVFVEMAGRNQGVLQLKVFSAPPEPGTTLDVNVVKFNADEGLYELTLPFGAAQVVDWGDIGEGIVVEARVTGHNKGGLECDVRNIRGFIPASQVSLYRVEQLEEFVGQKLLCIVTEANRDRKNLVLSHRAVLEREQAEAKKELLAKLEVGQMHEGIVRNLRDFGAFIDLGGVDGMLHVSQMSWDRIKHPSEVLTVGQKIQVKIQKIDPETQKISLSYRDQFESPWASAGQKYSPRTRVEGTVSKIMDFGAFVRLEPGIEGLVHISEISYKRVFRVSDVLQEGQAVEVQVMNVDSENQRISLSMKALEARPSPVERKSEPEPEEEVVAAAPKKERKIPLKGGIGQSSGGDKFGLKW